MDAPNRVAGYGLRQPLERLTHWLGRLDRTEVATISELPAELPGIGTDIDYHVNAGTVKDQLSFSERMSLGPVLDELPTEVAQQAF
jgi:hypothetical protein